MIPMLPRVAAHIAPAVMQLKDLIKFDFGWFLTGERQQHPISVTGFLRVLFVMLPESRRIITVAFFGSVSLLIFTIMLKAEPSTFPHFDLIAFAAERKELGVIVFHPI